MTIENSSVQVLGIDAGGTMTDTFFVRADGRFVVGKAQSNPGDESLAIYNSSVDALAHWGREVDDVYPELVTCVYSGTAMLNRVLMRKGLDDAQRAVSVLLQATGMDERRVGVAGHSYGGYTALYHAAVDARCRFACISGAVCSFETRLFGSFRLPTASLTERST